MELRHIRYFLAVADERNFTRAAARLGVAQPPLSIQIRDLEAEIGARLFRRTPRGAELTQAGEAFLHTVGAVPEVVARAVHAARQAARGETGRLRLGVTSSAALNPVVSGAVRAFRRAYPEVDFMLEEGNSSMLLSGLMEGRLDAAVLRPSGDDPAGVGMTDLTHEALIAALPAAHPAAGGCGPLELSALRRDPFILAPTEAGRSLHETTLKACRDAGFEPIIGQAAPQIASILSLVSAELGVSLAPECMRQLSINGVVFRRLRPPVPVVRLSIAWLENRRTPLVRNWLAVAASNAVDAPRA